MTYLQIEIEGNRSISHVSRDDRLIYGRCIHPGVGGRAEPAGPKNDAWRVSYALQLRDGKTLVAAEVGDRGGGHDEAAARISRRPCLPPSRTCAIPWRWPGTARAGCGSPRITPMPSWPCVGTRNCAIASSSSKTPPAKDISQSRKVFIENLEKLTSVAVGHGGVWAMCPPQLLFIPDKDGDGVPDGPAQVVLDGFKVSATGPYHTIANGLRFGPDGWLYGRGGGTNPGEIGFPGTPPEERTPLRGTHLALSSRAQSRRGGQLRHDQSLGPRLGRARRTVLHQHHQRPFLAQHRRRPLYPRHNDGPEPARLSAPRLPFGPPPPRRQQKRSRRE